MTKPPINTYIEWDESETPPVPVGTDVTVWYRETFLIGDAGRYTTDNKSEWVNVTAYLVHSYPPEDEVEDVWLVYRPSLMGEFSTYIRPVEIETNQVSVHLRFTNGVAEIVSQEKA